MHTLADYTRRDCAVYDDTRLDWGVFLTVNRDSDALERVNFEVADARLDAIDPAGEDHYVEHFGHWAVGWLDYLTVRPGSDCWALAETLLAKLADYPVLDEERWSEVEFEEAWCLRCDSAMRKEHPTATCSKFRDEDTVHWIKTQWRNRGTVARTTIPARWRDRFTLDLFPEMPAAPRPTWAA